MLGETLSVLKRLPQVHWLFNWDPAILRGIQGGVLVSTGNWIPVCASRGATRPRKTGSKNIKWQ